MPAWPKSVFVFGINLLSAAAELNLLQRGGAAALQARVFKRLVRQLAQARHWRETGVTAGMNYETFRTHVAPCTYARIAPQVGRMIHGERDVLWPGKCSLFALTSGTTDARPHYLPMTGDLLDHLQRAELESLLYFNVRMRNASVFHGRHLHLGGTRRLAHIPDSGPPPAHAGDVSAILATYPRPWNERHLFEPHGAIAQMSNWEEKLDALVAHSHPRDIALLSGSPTSALGFADALFADAAQSQGHLTYLQQRWPNLRCFVHTGLPVGPYYEELRAVLGPTVNFHEVYAATEGYLAVQDAHHRDGLRVLANGGLFFEFIPVDDYDESQIEKLGSRAVPLAEVKTGTDYAVLVTSPAGLARYALGDVVRFVSTTPPRLLVVGRTTGTLDLFGEKTTELQLSAAIAAVCLKQGWRLVNFHVAPQHQGNLTGQLHGRHEWWLELKPGTITTPIGPQIAASLDVELQQLNPLYAAKRKGGLLELPVVRLVMPGVFAHWQRYHGKWGGQHKLPRCYNHRAIADELARITNFAAD
ncbi:MAG: GH3 auxin-responsive promoter family protein [Verrucomicrobia bacterium]|nr:GH3 auxin-responsive promoter family protein [Verrucomicrobiota bacterium]